MNMKKTISFIILILMVISLVPGCSARNAGEVPVESQEPADVPATEEPAEEAQGLKLGYELTDEEKYTKFFMDRPFALDAASAGAPTQAEFDRASSFLNDYILDSVNTGKCAFNFNVDGTSFADSVKEWQSNTETSDSENSTDYTVTFTKPGDPLTVTVYASLYKHYPIAEYTVWLKDTGSGKTGQISDFYGFDGNVGEFEEGSEVRLTTFQGSHEANSSFNVETIPFGKGSKKIMSGVSGKPTFSWSPYINFQWENKNALWGKEGMFISTGWSGQWSTSVSNSGTTVSVQTGQEKFDLYLNPGEDVRSPLMSMLFWEQDIMRCQNMWRRWVYNEVMYHPNGEPIKTSLAGNTAQDTNLTIEATTENQVEAIKKWVEYGFDIDAWQMDAGWYESANGQWIQTGSWSPNSKRFNGSLAEIGQTLADNNIRFILWYEPERVQGGTEWATQFAGTDFLLTRGGNLFNFSSDEATDWIIGYMTNHIKSNKVSVYRQDCNISVSAGGLVDYWIHNDDKGRLGYTENKYIRNYLRYFDAMNELTGDIVDGCASGGKRQDLESLKRSAALWRDDACYDATLTQCQSWGINFFIPYSGHGSLEQSVSSMQYTFRSNLTPSMLLPWRLGSVNAGNLDLHKKMISEFRKYSDYLTKDYYPLSEYSEDSSAWMAWQYSDPETTSGIIQVFRRGDSTEVRKTYYMNGLDPEKTYHVEDIDTGDFIELTGQQLMCDGFTVTLATTVSAPIFYYYPV